MKIQHIVIALCIISPFSAKAQGEMTLAKCREMALNKNHQIEIASLNNEKAKQTVVAARSNFLPKFSASGTYLLTNNKINKTLGNTYLPTFVPDASGNLVPNIQSTAPDGSPIFKEYAYIPEMSFDLNPNGTYFAGVSVEQPIFMGGKIVSGYKMSKIGTEIAELNQRLTRAEVIQKTDEAFWMHVKAIELQKAARKYKEVVSEFYRNVENAHQVGLKLKNDVLKVQVKVNEAELQLRKADNAVRLSRINLCHVIGVSLDTPIILAESFNVSSIDVQPTADILSRPEYSILEKQVELKHQQIKMVRSDFLPSVGVMGGYNYGYGLKLNNNPLWDKASLSAMLSVKIPLFQWGEGRSKVRAAKLEKQIVQLQRDDLNEKMELELVKSINEYDEATLEVELTTQAMSQAEENLQVSRNQYDVGRESLADYLEAQTIWQKAWADMINAKASQKLSETTYLKAAGKL